MKKRIEMTFDEEGNVTIEAFGYSGTECRLATQPFEDAAGKVVDRKAKTPLSTETVKKAVKA